MANMSTICWRPWPGEKPKEVGGESQEVLIAVIDTATGRQFVTTDWTKYGRWYHMDILSSEPKYRVVAWCDFPKFPVMRRGA